MKIPVIGYILAWDTKNNRGSIFIKLENGPQKTINPQTAEEFAALAAVLNESPVFFDTSTEIIQTGWEQAGGA